VICPQSTQRSIVRFLHLHGELRFVVTPRPSNNNKTGDLKTG
jgi:hypothetical protein